MTRLIVRHVTLRDFRSYATARTRLCRRASCWSCGENGAGKTNLLEALHVGTQGFSPRTRTRRTADPLRRRSAAAVGARGHARRRRARRCGCGSRRRPSRSAPSSTARGSPSAELLRREFPTLVFTPDRLAWSRVGRRCGARTSTASLGRLYPARARGCRRSTWLRSPSGTRRCGGCSWALRRATRSSPGRRAWPSSAPRSTSAARRDARRARARASRSGRRARPAAGATLGYDRPSRRPPRSSKRRLDADIARGATGLGPHLDDILVEARRPRPAQLRLAGRAAAGACSRCCSPRPSCCPSRRCCCSTTCSPSSTRGRRAHARRANREAGADRGHRDRSARRFPARAEPGGGGEPWTGSADDEVRAELVALRPAGRARPSSSSAGRRRSARRSPATRGRRAIAPRRDAARRTRPTRSGRSSSAQRAAEIAGRLGVAGGALRARARCPAATPRRLAPRPARADARARASRRRAIAAGDRRREPPQKCAKSGQSAASPESAVRPPRLIHLL